MNERNDLDGGEEEVAARLSQLDAVRAPASLAPVVLAGVGIVDAYAPVETVIGPMFVAYNREGISAVRPAADRAAFEGSVGTRTGRALRAIDRLPSELERRIAARLSGSGGADLRFDLRRLSGFERAVLEKAREIPRGEVRPYGWIAREIGRPAAVRAVGGALGRNPVPLLIPCHRVVRSDGRIDGYAFGTGAKRTLLADEGVDPDRLEAQAQAGERFWASRTTRIFCFPTCRNARRITERHRVAFTSAAEAEGAGFRPCRVCRPVPAA